MDQAFPTIKASWGITVFCLAISGPLFASWIHSPYDHLGWLAFSIWLLPIALIRNPDSIESTCGSLTNSRPDGSSTKHATPIALSWSGLIFGTAGNMGELNALKYIGLSFAIASLRRWSGIPMCWMCASISWMPFFGWLARDLQPSTVTGLRIFLASSGTIWQLAMSSGNASSPRK